MPDIIAGSLATFGYGNKRATWELEAAMDFNPRGYIVDTRTTPYCEWDAQWIRHNLEKKYGKRYIWKGNILGNVNYNRPEAGIQVAHLDTGVEWLIRLMEKGYTPILLCGCGGLLKCHRKVIFDAVCAQLGPRFPLVEPGDRVVTPDGAGKVDDISAEFNRMRDRYPVILQESGKRQYYRLVDILHVFERERIEDYEQIDFDIA
jgi:hypothetical protein